jgi:hypothetical protein
VAGPRRGLACADQPGPPPSRASSSWQPSASTQGRRLAGWRSPRRRKRRWGRPRRRPSGPVVGIPQTVRAKGRLDAVTMCEAHLRMVDRRGQWWGVAAHPPHSPLTIPYKPTANLEQSHLPFTTIVSPTGAWLRPTPDEGLVTTWTPLRAVPFDRAAPVAARARRDHELPERTCGGRRIHYSKRLLSNFF